MYRCKSCEYETLRWEGKCSNCGEWGSLDDSGKNSSSDLGDFSYLSISYSKIVDHSIQKTQIVTGIGEFDRVLGGGLIPGQVVMLSGEPGIGKSTILSQVVVETAKQLKVLYISGEESISQSKQRFDRFVEGPIDNIFLSSESVLDNLSKAVKDGRFKIIVVDSIQSVTLSTVPGAVGSVSQTRAVGAFLVAMAKSLGVTLVIVGQINKEGQLAGPKVVEHLVDTVLHFSNSEGYRILSCSKNRFGSTDEIGVFEMRKDGMVGVADPSSVFINGESGGVGSVLSAFVAGSRVVFVEVQALVVERLGDVSVKRIANGYKRQKLEMLSAVISRYTKISLSSSDVFVSVLGGVDTNSSYVDLAVSAAIISSALNTPIKQGSLFLGEVGLTGGVKPVSRAPLVLKDAKRLGFSNLYLNSDKRKGGIVSVGSLFDAIRTK